MKLVPYGAASGNVIPSRIFLQGKDAKESILLDCGDSIPEKGEKNHRIDFGSLRPSIVKKILASHGHTDHVGALPAFVQAGFKGEIESTQGTKEITSALLRDNYPQALVNDVFDRYQKPRKYLERFEIADGVYATFYPARGHILEASSILLEFERLKLRVLSTGDLGNNKMMLDINGAVPKVDIVISESTYGHRAHHPDFNLSLEQLHEGIRTTCKNEGNFFIPVLSINKLQEVLFHVNLAREKGDIPNDVNVVVDSALGEAITRIYNKPHFRHLYSLDAIKFFNSYSKVHPFAYTTEIQPKGKNIILASSGLDGLRGRFRNYFNALSDENNSVAIVSHTLEGSPLNDMAEGKETIGTNGNSIPFNAKSFTLSGFSSHADATQLLEFLKKTEAKFFILLHGENYSRMNLKDLMLKAGMVQQERILLPDLFEELDLTNLPPSKDSVSIPASINRTVDSKTITLLGQKVEVPRKFIKQT